MKTKRITSSLRYFVSLSEVRIFLILLVFCFIFFFLLTLRDHNGISDYCHSNPEMCEVQK